MLVHIINHIVNIVNDHPALTPISRASTGHTEKYLFIIFIISIIIIIRVGTVGRQQPIATQFLRIGIIFVFVIIIIISSVYVYVYVYVYRCKLEIQIHFTSLDRMISARPNVRKLDLFFQIRLGGRRIPVVACWVSDHWVASSNPLRGKFRH